MWKSGCAANQKGRDKARMWCIDYRYTSTLPTQAAGWLSSSAEGLIGLDVHMSPLDQIQICYLECLAGAAIVVVYADAPIHLRSSQGAPRRVSVVSESDGHAVYSPRAVIVECA